MADKNKLQKVDMDNQVANTGAARGFDHVDITEVSMPQIKVLQPTSPEVKEGIGKMGDIIHTAASTTTTGEFIPVLIWTSRAFFTPRDQMAKLKLLQELGIEDDTGYLTMICKSSNGQAPDFSQCNRSTCYQCPYAQWQGNKPPLCGQTLNVLVYDTNLGLPGVIRFSSTNLKYGRRFRDTSMWLGVDLFANKYQLEAKLISGNKGEYYVSPVKLLGKASKEEHQKGLELYNQFSSLVFNIQDDENQNQETAF